MSLNEDLWDAFAATAELADFLTLPLEVLTKQVGELRAYYDTVGEPIEYNMTDAEIAEALMDYAHKWSVEIDEGE